MANNLNNYLGKIAASFAFAGALAVSGCSSTGYRPAYQDKQIKEDLRKQEYSESIDVFAEREIALLNSTTTNFVATHPQQRNTIATLTAAAIPSYNSQSATMFIQKIDYQNKILKNLFKENKIQRWLLDAVKKNTNCSLNYNPLTERETAEVYSNLEALADSADRTSFAQRQTSPVPQNARSVVSYNSIGLNYVTEVLTAKADIETIEFDVREMALAYKLASKIKKSTKNIDEAAIEKTAWNKIAAELIVQDSDSLFKDVAIQKSATFSSVYNLLLAKSEEILRNGSYADKHNAFQNLFSHLFDIPSVLYNHKKITAEEAVALKKKITNDISNLFEINNIPNTRGLRLSQAGFSLIPVAGLFDFEDWRNCVTTDWFNPDADSIEKKYSLILQEGRRLNSGDGNSEKFVGTTNPAIISRGLAVASTAVTATVVAVAMSSSNGGDHNNLNTNNSPAPVPPIDGGGQITPGNGNNNPPSAPSSPPQSSPSTPPSSPSTPPPINGGGNITPGVGQ